MPRKYKLIISDLHIGSGQKPGHMNPWESFAQDDKFAEFLRFYSTDYFEDEEVELIIAGDFYDLLQVPIDGRFPDRITEPLAVRKIEACIEGHPKVHKALRDFVAQPKKRIVVLPGNHDYEWIFPKVQERFCEAIAGAPTSPLVHFVCDRESYEFDGIQVQHGMQFELHNYHNFREQLLRANGAEPILNLPWGSIFILKAITRLKEERPYIDKVRPFKAYFIRAIIFDPIFAIKVLLFAVWLFIRTRVLSLRHFGARLRQNWRMLKEADVYPDLVHNVRRHLEKHPEIGTLVLGHTHIPLVRRFEGDRRYVNTGCWTGTVSLEIESFGRESKPTYGYIEYPENDDPPVVALREWRGYHDLYRDIYF